MLYEPVEFYVRYPVQQRRTVEVSEMVLKSAPNKLHKDGRIYFEDEEGNYIAITVSPLHVEFASQIEIGVWPLVKSLVDKGYLTVSSCEGHDGSNYYVKIVFNGKQSANEFIDQLPSIPGLEVKIEEQSANVIRYVEHGEVKYRKAFPDENVSKHEEVKFINMLFNRQYTDCCYVTLLIYPKISTLNPLKYYRYHKEKTKNFSKSRTCLVDFVKNNLLYYTL